MNLMKKSQKKYLPALTSLFGHMIILLSFLLYFDNATTPVNFGETSSRAITSYLSNDTRVSPAAARSAIKSASNAISLLSPAKIKPQNSGLSSPAAGNGQPVPELVALLHAAIQAQQHYPASALEMEREGRVTLTFKLFPNGDINHLRIINSSGTISLDDAAIAAVNQAAPFKKIEKYLHQPQEYRIDVVFELT